MLKDESAQSFKVAIVTGAAVRIGAHITRLLHEAGYNVLVHYRSSETAARQLVDELCECRADSAACVQAELCKQDSANALIEAAVVHWGRLDLLVNNASEFFPTPVGKITTDDIEKLFGTNLQAPLLLAQAGFPYLKNHEGSVINIIDIYSTATHQDHSVYCASKAALSMLTKSFARDFAPAVRVNGISPGAILWPEGDSKLSEAEKKSLLKNVPLKRKGNAKDIADAVLYLASANYVTGHILTVDGGRTL